MNCLFHPWWGSANHLSNRLPELVCLRLQSKGGFYRPGRWGGACPRTRHSRFLENRQKTARMLC